MQYSVKYFHIDHARAASQKLQETNLGPMITNISKSSNLNPFKQKKFTNVFFKKMCGFCIQKNSIICFLIYFLNLLCNLL